MYRLNKSGISNRLSLKQDAAILAMPSLSPLVSHGKAIPYFKKSNFVEKIHQPVKFTKTMPKPKKRNKRNFFDDLDINTTPEISSRRSPDTPSDHSRKRHNSSKSYREEEENIDTTEDDSQESVSPKKKLSFRERTPVSKKTPLRKENVLSDASEEEVEQIEEEATQSDDEEEEEEREEEEREEEVDITGIRNLSFNGSPSLNKISRTRSINVSPIKSSNSPKFRGESPRRKSPRLKISGKSPKTKSLTESPRATIPTRSPIMESPRRSLRKNVKGSQSPKTASPSRPPRMKSPATSSKKTPNRIETSELKSKKTETKTHRSMETQAGSSRVNRTLKRQRAPSQNVEEQPRVRRLTRSQVEKSEDIPIASFMKMLDTTMNATGDADAVFTKNTSNNQSVIDHSKYATMSKSYVDQRSSSGSRNVDFQVSQTKKGKVKADNKKILSQTAPVQARDETISSKKNQNSSLNKSKKSKRRTRLTMPPRQPSKSNKSNIDDTKAVSNKSKVNKSKSSRGVTFDDKIPPTKKAKQTPVKNAKRTPVKNVSFRKDVEDDASDDDSMEGQSSTQRVSISPKRLPTPHPSRTKRKVAERKSENVTEETEQTEETEEEEEEVTIVDYGSVFENEKKRRLRPRIPVKDKEKNIMTTRELSIPPSEVDWKLPSKNASKKDILIFRAFSVPNVMTGQLLIKPGRSKGQQKTKKDALVFYVIRGLLKVCLEDNEWCVTSGETFLIPEGCQYNLTNQSKYDARLFFVSSRVTTS